MKCIITPVTQASILIYPDEQKFSIAQGLLIYVGISQKDTEVVSKNTLFLENIVTKILSAKLFHSEQSDKIDTNILENKGEILLVSNFTLYGNNKKGTKIDFGDAARFSDAQFIYNSLVEIIRKNNIILQTGEFGAKMEISSVNLGPLNYIFEF